MSNDPVVEYESWDLSEPALPSRSRFYHLEPVGWGTGMVESLTSYFSRLAEAHSVSAGALLHHELVPRHAARRNMFSCVVTARTRAFTATINNVGHMAVRFAAVVGRLTGRKDLHRLTMLPWKSVMPPQLLTRGVAGWCPRCLTEWRAAGQPIYMPLLWALEVVKYCPEHRCPIALVCPHCQLPQSLMGQCCPVGQCTRCKHWLGDGAESPKDTDRYTLVRPEAPEWEIWAAQQVKDLIRVAFDSPSPLTRPQLSRLLWAATDVEGLSHLARLLGVCPASVIAWRAGEKQPMLPAYLRIACILNVNLADRLTGHVAPESARSLNVDRVPYWRNLYLVRKPTFDPRKAKRQLEEALAECPPPSLTTFRKRTGYHYDTLCKHFPELCQALCDRFQQHRSALIQKRQADKIAEFRKIAYELHEEGVELFVNRVAKRMTAPRSLKYRIACDLFNEVKREILAKERTKK